MEEFEFKRSDTCEDKSQVTVSFDKVDIGWGFRLKQESIEAKKARLGTGRVKKTLELEKVSEPQISGLNIDMKMGDMLAVVGQVGCGKTTFLQSILQETVVMNGNLKVQGSIAYVEQEPFIISASVRKNILFGKEYNEKQF